MAVNSQFQCGTLWRANGASTKRSTLRLSGSGNTPVRYAAVANSTGAAFEARKELQGGPLARCPKEITLAEIYNAVSCGEIFALHGKTPNQDCPVGKNIEAVLCGLQKEIDKSVGEKLSEYTLQGILEIIEQGKG